MQKLLIPTLLGLAMFAGVVNAAAPLRPPQGYFAPVEAFKTGDFKNDCDAMPANSKFQLKVAVDTAYLCEYR